MKKPSNKKNLEHQDAIEKLKELVGHNPICMFATRLREIPSMVRPMTTAKVCDQGNFWFLSDVQSNENEDISMDSRVQLFFSNSHDYEYMSVFGRASIIKDQQKIDELWSPLAKAWFPKGKDDPYLGVIKVTPEEVFYWDTTNGKMISFLKIVAAALTGHQAEVGVTGQITV